MQTQKSQQLGLRPKTLVLQGNHATTVPPYSLYLVVSKNLPLCSINIIFSCKDN